MSRTWLAALAGTLFVLAYIVLAVTLPDLIPPQGWAVQAAYWLVAGILWVFPVWGLLLWAVRGR